MVVVHFPVRIPPRWTALQHTFADRWPSLWLRVACARCPCTAFLCDRCCQALVAFR